MTLKFAETAIPVMERPKEPNPFADAVALVAGKEKAVTTVVPVDEKDGPDDKDPTGRTIGRIRRQLTEAGDPHNVTVRTQIVPTDDGKGLRVTLWTIPKIVRQKKTGDDSATTAEAVAA